MSQPAPKPDRPSMKRLAGAEDLARDRFGDTEGLAVVANTTLELASHYAKQYGLEMSDPDVQVLASALAFARHKEFLLLQEMERDIQRRVLSSGESTSYGEVLFRTAKTGAYAEVNREITRLHSRAESFHRELRALAVVHD